MFPTINLDINFPFCTIEIQDVWSKGILPLDSIPKLVVLNSEPKRHLRFGHVLPKVSRLITLRLHFNIISNVPPKAHTSLAREVGEERTGGVEPMDGGNLGTGDEAPCLFASKRESNSGAEQRLTS